MLKSAGKLIPWRIAPDAPKPASQQNEMKLPRRTLANVTEPLTDSNLPPRQTEAFRRIQDALERLAERQRISREETPEFGRGRLAFLGSLEAELGGIIADIAGPAGGDALENDAAAAEEMQAAAESAEGMAEETERESEGGGEN